MARALRCLFAREAGPRSGQASARPPVARAARARSILGGQLAVTSAVLAALIAYPLAHGAAAVTRETAHAVTRLVRDPRTSVRGVALLDRLVCGGYSSALYAGCPDRLARELGRIRFLLQAE